MIIAKVGVSGQLSEKGERKGTFMQFVVKNFNVHICACTCAS